MADRLGVALLVWHFVCVLDRLLVTLLLYMLLAVRATGVTSISFTLSMIAVAIAVTNLVTKNRTVMANNIGGVVNILVFIMTVLGDNVLTFLNESSGHNNFMFLVAHLLVVTLLLVHNVVVQSALDITHTMTRMCLGHTGEEKKSTKSKHFTG